MPQIIPVFSAIIGAATALGTSILGALGTIGAFLTSGSLGAALLNIGSPHGMSFDQPTSSDSTK